MPDRDGSEKRIDLLIRDTLEVIQARRQGLEMALALGFPLPEATKIAVVISELARNILNYAGYGTITLITRGGKPPDAEDAAHGAGPTETSFEITARDRGPGIADVARVLAGGYSTSGGLGKGVSGSRRLMDTFQIDSRVGFGTTIKATKRLRT